MMSLSKKRKIKAETSRRTPRKAAQKKAVPERASKARLPEKKEVKIAAAKGRPMLTWVGKHSLQRVTAFPAQLVEKFDPRAEWRDAGPQSGALLFHGDNKEVLAYLLANGYRGKVNLVYIDPPFDSGADYVRKVTLRGAPGSVKLGGEAYTLGEQIQYTDIWANDSYLQFMYERLLLLKELLSSPGSIVLHANSAKGHLLRCVMDEVFSADCMRNEITWKYVKYQMGNIKQFVDNTDRLYWYTKGDKWTYNLQMEALEKPKELLAKGWDKRKGVIVNLKDESGKTYKIVINEEKVDDFWDLPFEEDITVRSEDFRLLKLNRIPGDNSWLLPYIAAPSYERTGYPTQKPEVLIKRIIKALANPHDLILDCFIGSGTTAAVAQKLGLRWIGCDINKGAIQTTSKRLQKIIEDQIEVEEDSSAQGQLIEFEKDTVPKPAQFSFSVHRVNDYDLQIQHNEAVNLACEHIGIKRTKSDPFFEGELGKKLVKIIPFNHPLSPPDVEEIKNELAARPDEDRDVVVVSLGKELAVDRWLEEWNRYRKQKGFPNKIEIIELRTDERYGKFFEHKPAEAKTEIKRAANKIKIRIRDFISPTILERLQQQAGILAPQIADWRSMVDSVMIDTAYDGKVFNVTYSDVPERKNDLVAGEYELDAPKRKTTVAVKITDMLGEEVLHTQRL
jgi:DNA modification methylase